MSNNQNKDQQETKRRNFVAKYMHQFNKPKKFKDRTKYTRKRRNNDKLMND